MSETTFDGTLICDMSSDTTPAEELSAKGFAVTSAANPTACAIPLSAVIRRRPCFIRRSKDGGACQANRLPSYFLDVQLANHFQHSLPAVCGETSTAR